MAAGPGPGTVEAMIEVHGLTKRYGATLAVDDLSFDVLPGHVTGFLGPNGSGKSTTMRAILGLDTLTSGGVLVNGRSYRRLRAPLSEVGALLDARAVHGGRTARNHLLALATRTGSRCVGSARSSRSSGSPRWPGGGQAGSRWG